MVSAAALMLILLAGCGGGNEGADPPDDFAITVDYADGSVPPPFHVEWTLTVDRDGQGTLDYTPDYPGDGVPTYTAQFDVEAAVIADLYNGLVDNDLLRSQDPATDTPVGGPTETATVTADGETYEIPAYADGIAPLQPVEGQIHRLVPKEVWNDFAQRRKAYEQRRYDEQP